MQDTQTNVNDSETSGSIDARLTQGCSGFDHTFEDDRRRLIAKRVQAHADTPDGHTYSNILELRKNWEKSKPGDFAQQHLPRLMLEQEKRLRVKET